MNKRSEEIYNDEFYRNRNKTTRYSARKILEVLFANYKISSVIDFGCGVGTWLSEAKRMGINEIKGLDGDYVNRKYLTIEKEEFRPIDLSRKVTLNQKYDLAISLEVAEHLSGHRAKGFVDDLCNTADIVLFSAATKKQGGDGHINEQRLSYWIRLFDKRGYEVSDMIRPLIWNDVRIPVWYRENVVVFVNRNSNIPLVDISGNPPIYDMIHPELYEMKVEEFEQFKRKKVIKAYLCIENLVKKVLG